MTFNISGSSLLGQFVALTLKQDMERAAKARGVDLRVVVTENAEKSFPAAKKALPDLTPEEHKGILFDIFGLKPDDETVATKAAEPEPAEKAEEAPSMSDILKTIFGKALNGQEAEQAADAAKVSDPENKGPKVIRVDMNLVIAVDEDDNRILVIQTDADELLKPTLMPREIVLNGVPFKMDERYVKVSKALCRLEDDAIDALTMLLDHVKGREKTSVEEALVCALLDPPQEVYEHLEHLQTEGLIVVRPAGRPDATKAVSLTRYALELFPEVIAK